MKKFDSDYIKIILLIIFVVFMFILEGANHTQKIRQDAIGEMENEMELAVEDAYGEGYDDGYADGYEAGLSAAQH